MGKRDIAQPHPCGIGDGVGHRCQHRHHRRLAEGLSASRTNGVWARERAPRSAEIDDTGALMLEKIGVQCHPTVLVQVQFLTQGDAEKL